MKIRIGFVTNSSSSSFVVAFDQIPKSAQELHEMMFGKGGLETIKLYDFMDEVSTNEISQIVFHDLINATPIENVKDLTFIFESGYYDELDFESYRKEDNRIDWERYDHDKQILARKVADDFLEKAKGKLIYVFEYADNDGGIYCTMEHGRIFSKFLHKRISHH